MKIQTVGQVVTSPTSPVFAHLDLRFFRKIELSDTENGHGNPTSGDVYTAILYGKTIIYESTQSFENGEVSAARSSGLLSGPMMFDAAQLFQRVRMVAQAKFHGHDTTHMSEADALWDVVCDDAALALLKTHPQFHEAREIFGIAFQPVTDDETSDRRITVWKHHTKG